jgi:hypothetical protein
MDSGVLQCRPIMFPWGVKDAIRGVRNEFNRCSSLGQETGVVQFLIFCRISCNSTPNSKMAWNCCSRRDSLIFWSVSMCSNTASNSCNPTHLPVGNDCFSKLFFCDRLLLELLLSTVVCPVLEWCRFMHDVVHSGAGHVNKVAFVKCGG